jgi:ElaB/YqjD/DUF883 family membrane-anchored ribosome-binding protein
MDSLDTTHVRKAKRYANANINDFLDNVDDLTKAIKDVETPDIARVRAKVKMALSAAKSALAVRRASSPGPRTAMCATTPGRWSASQPSSALFSA